LTDVDLSIGNKQTPRHDAKTNAAQDDEHNAALGRQNHKKNKRKNLICVKTT